MERSVSMHQEDWSILLVVCLEQVAILEREGNHMMAQYLHSEVLPRIRAAADLVVQTVLRG